MRLSALLLGILSLLSTSSQAQTAVYFTEPPVPPNFHLDIETGIRLRSQLLAQSVAPNGRFTVGQVVFEHLVAQVPPMSTKFVWELRIVDGDQITAYSSPEGTVYVDASLARLVDQSAGLWAAILSHEIAHIARRDWARRYFYQKSLETDGAQAMVLGDPGSPSGSWMDSQKASAELGEFCRRLELEADRDSLVLMARAGYHPHFVPALHHLLHANGSDAAMTSSNAMHPCWEERDRELMRAYVNASIEYERRWPEPYASPGGNPPIVVFATTPIVKKTSSKTWEVQTALRCDNLAGAVEVVLHGVSTSGHARHARSKFELREVTGCTSPVTIITFTLPLSPDAGKPAIDWSDVSVLDDWGAVLARMEIPKLPH